MQEENQTHPSHQPTETTLAPTKPRPRKKNVDKKLETVSGARPVVYSQNVYHQTIAEYLIRKA